MDLVYLIKYYSATRNRSKCSMYYPHFIKTPLRLATKNSSLHAVLDPTFE